MSEQEGTETQNEGGSGDEGGGGEAVEKQARSMGWQPESEWKGRKEAWVDAAEFVKRGETFVPFLQHERKKLRGELETERRERQQLQQELASVREGIGELRTFNEKMAQERQERRKAELGAAL